jgi:hypothetical protein
VTSRIVVALRVKADPRRTFDVFTREIGLWWRHREFFKFTPRSPGVLSFEPPGEDKRGRLIETLKYGKVFEIGDVRVWEPGERLVVGWRQATFPAILETEVEVRFEPVGDETRITVEHRGWDRVPSDHVAKHSFPEALFVRRHGEYWGDLLESFATRL